MSDPQTEAYQAGLSDYQVSYDVADTGQPLLDLSAAGWQAEHDGYSYQQRNSLLGAGFEQGKGTFWKGVGETAGLMGMENVESKMLEWSTKNMNDAQADRDGFIDDVIFTAGQVGVPLAAATGAALAAPFVGMTAAVGAGIAALATGWGMTAGDFYMKEQEYDEEYQPTSTDLGITGLLTLPELLPIGRFAKLATPLADAVTRTAYKTADGLGANIAQGAAQYGIEATKDFGIGFVTEASQDFAGSVLAAERLDVEVDDARLAAMGRAALYEGLLGGTVSGSLGTARTYKDRAVAKRQAAISEDSDLGPAPQLQDEEGNLSQEFKEMSDGMTLVEGAVKQPGMISVWYDTLLGNATDKVRARHRGNAKLNALLNNFNMRKGDRTPGAFTTNEKARAMEGKAQKAAWDYNTGSKKRRQEAWDAKARGETLDTKEFKALSLLLDDVIPDMVEKSSRGKIKKDSGLFGRADYVPTMIMQDWKSMTKAWQDGKIQEEALADLISRGKSEKEIATAMQALETMVASYAKTGDHLTYAKMDKENRFGDTISSMVKKFTTDKDGNVKPMKDKDRRKLKRKVAEAVSRDKRQSPLTLDRALGAFSPEFLNNYRKKDDPKHALNAHIRMVTEHMAHMENFGVDNVLFDEAVIDIVADSYEMERKAREAGNLDVEHMRPDEVDKLYDILRTSQRIHLRPMKSQAMRTAQNNIRGAANIILLGLSTLVSIPEALVIFMNTGGKNALQGLGQTVAQGLGAERFGIASRNLGYTLETSLSHAINRTGEEAHEVQGWESAFIRYGTGLPYLQHFLTVWAARANDVQIRSHLKELSENQTSPKRQDYLRRKLQEAGLDVEQAKNWYQTGAKENSPFFEDTYAPALIGLTQDTIVDPHPIDKPLWMNDENFLLLTQLKGFMTVFTNRVMRNWGRVVRDNPDGNIQLATRIAPYVAMYIAAQVAMQAVREVLKNGDLDDWDDQDMSERVFNAFGYLGGMSYFIDPVNSMRHRSDPLAGVLGPVPSMGVNLARDTVENIERQDPEGQVKDMIKRFFPNVPFKDVMIEAMVGE